MKVKQPDISHEMPLMFQPFQIPCTSKGRVIRQNQTCSEIAKYSLS